MRQSNAFYLVAMGILFALGTIVGFSAEYDSFDAGQSEFATVLILAMSFGVLLTGWLAIREHSRYQQVPALFLGLVGLTSIVGSIVVFQPWQYGGLAGGLRSLIVAGLTVVGVMLIVIANH